MRVCVHDAIPVPAASVIHIVADEAITAAFESGDASRLRAELTSRDGAARLVVEHDGAVNVEMPSTFAARQRVALAGGRYDVSFSPESGTRITATIPLALPADSEETQ
jgi:signal transduction histidine kinase